MILLFWFIANHFTLCKAVFTIRIKTDMAIISFDSKHRSARDFAFFIVRFVHSRLFGAADGGTGFAVASRNDPRRQTAARGNSLPVWNRGLPVRERVPSQSCSMPRSVLKIMTLPVLRLSSIPTFFKRKQKLPIMPCGYTDKPCKRPEITPRLLKALIN